MNLKTLVSNIVGGIELNVDNIDRPDEYNKVLETIGNYSIRWSGGQKATADTEDTLHGDVAKRLYLKISDINDFIQLSLKEKPAAIEILYSEHEERDLNYTQVNIEDLDEALHLLMNRGTPTKKETKFYELFTRDEDQKSLEYYTKRNHAYADILDNPEEVLVIDGHYKILRHTDKNITVYIHITDKRSSFALPLKDIHAWVDRDIYISKVCVYVLV